MVALWKVELLRELRVIGTEHTVLRFRSRMIGALLGFLAYRLGTRQPRDLLVELLWPECDCDTGRLRFRVALNSLRRQLEPPGVPAGSVLLADRTSVQLNPERVATDVAEFRTALRAAAAGGGCGGQGSRAPGRRGNLPGSAPAPALRGLDPG
jgi:DNA-binding SARP family transcriptional activator